MSEYPPLLGLEGSKENASVFFLDSLSLGLPPTYNGYILLRRKRMMNMNIARKTLDEALRQLFGKMTVRVIIARDHDVSLKVLTNTTVWETLDKKGKVVDLRAGRTISTCILGLPMQNAKKIWMVPILWGGRKCWTGWKSLEETKIQWGDKNS